MAQFLNRLGSLDGLTFPSVNADKVDGLHADELTRMSSITVISTTALPEFPNEVQYGDDLTIEAGGGLRAGHRQRHDPEH